MRATTSARPITQLGTTYGGPWITLQHAYEILGLNGQVAMHTFRGLPTRKRSPIENVSGRRPTMLRLTDVERVKLIVEQCGSPVRIAVRFVVAELEGRI